MNYNLKRFKDAHDRSYRVALEEIRNWKKDSHWMWYIFPQIEWLWDSSTSKKYAIKWIWEAKAYLKDKELRSHLIESLLALLDLKENISEDIFWKVDALKLHSCLTLFHQVEPDNEIFNSVLEKFYNWELDLKTLSILGILWEEMQWRLDTKIRPEKYEIKNINELKEFTKKKKK
jgi:uncharacterized protein (DUF1810 family)